MSGQNSAGTSDVPNRAIRDEETFGEKIEGLPNTVLFFLFSFGIFLSAVVINVFGYAVLAAVIAATGVIFMGLAVVTHAGYVLLGKLG